MANCYLCDELITELNWSDEHILPNSVGGRNKSKELLCNPCNKKLGLLIDPALADFVALLASKYNIIRDRKKVPDFIAHDPVTGEELVVAAGIKIGYRHPRIVQGSNSVSFLVHNIKRARQEIERWKKNEGKDKVIISEVIAMGEPKYQEIIYKRVIEPDLVIRAVAKIFVNYYIAAMKDKTACTPLISFLKNDLENRYGWFFDLDICKHLHESKPKHIIIIKGDRKGKAIYGYVELFGETGFIMLINGQYSGDDFQLNYTFDISDYKEEDHPYNFPLKAGDIINIIMKKPESRMMKKLEVTFTDTFNK